MKKVRCVNGLSSPFYAGHIYRVQCETSEGYFIDGFKGIWEKARFEDA